MSPDENGPWTVEWRFRSTDPWTIDGEHGSLDGASKAAEEHARTLKPTARVRGADGTIAGEWRTQWRVEVRKSVDEEWRPLGEHEYLPDARDAAITFAYSNDAITRVLSPEGETCGHFGRRRGRLRN